MDATKFATTASNDLKAAEYKGKNFKVTIDTVTTRAYEATEKQAADEKLVLSFSGKEKGLVLNKTNTKILIGAYGADTDGWIGNEIGLSTHETDLGTGWVVTPLNVAPPDFDDEIGF